MQGMRVLIKRWVQKDTFSVKISVLSRAKIFSFTKSTNRYGMRFGLTRLLGKILILQPFCSRATSLVLCAWPGICNRLPVRRS